MLILVDRIMFATDIVATLVGYAVHAQSYSKAEPLQRITSGSNDFAIVCVTSPRRAISRVY